MWSCMSLLSSRIAQNFTRRNIGTFPHWARQWPLPQCGFQSLQLSPPSVLDLHVKQLSYAIEQSFPGSCRLQFQLFLRTVTCALQIWHGIFHMVPLACILLALPRPVEVLKSLATSTIFYWALFMLLYSFLVHDTHLVTCFAKVVLAFSSNNITVGGVFHLGVNVFVVNGHWLCWCDCKSKNCLRSQVLICIFLENTNSVSEELQPNL